LFISSCIFSSRLISNIFSHIHSPLVPRFPCRFSPSCSSSSNSNSSFNTCYPHRLRCSINRIFLSKSLVRSNNISINNRQ
jgi:hypothetical protein